MEEYLKTKITRLNREIEKLENQKVPTQKTGKVDYYAHNSDVGRKTFYDEVDGWVSMTSEEIRLAQKDKEDKLYSLRKELKQAQDELFKINWNKPENVQQREEEKIREDKELVKKNLEKERKEHGQQYDDLNKLVEYLKIAGLKSLANTLSDLRFAFQKTKSSYIIKEIDLQVRERELQSNTKTTKKEKRQIKRSVIILSKQATRWAKKYKGLYELYNSASDIVSDIKRKKILNEPSSEWARLFKMYFTQAKGEYLTYCGGYYIHKEQESLGYQYLEFYRDYDDKYNEDKRKQKMH